MGLLATARSMPGPTKIKRGIGLLLVGLLAWLLGGAIVAASDNVVFEQYLAALVGLVAIAAAASGVALLLWGLLRD